MIKKKNSTKAEFRVGEYVVRIGQLELYQVESVLKDSLGKGLGLSFSYVLRMTGDRSTDLWRFKQSSLERAPLKYIEVCLRLLERWKEEDLI